MSGDDENRNRTVFRPSPLQGLRNRTGETGTTAFTPGVSPPPQASPPQAAPAPFAQPAPYAQPAAPPQSAARPVERLPDDDVPRPTLAQKVRNVMVDKAGPALALAASVRAGRIQIPLPQLHAQAIALIGAFDRVLQEAGYPDEQRQRAKYALCATFDDIAQNLPGLAHDGAEWARRSMTIQFFSENIGGDRFWQLVDDMLARPAQNSDLIEFYHACLAAGFEGRFRVMGDGRRRLDEVMSRLYAALEHVRGLSPLEVSPHWRGHPAPMSKLGFWAPLALAAGVAVALLFVIYVVLRLFLMQGGDPAMTALKAINPGEPLRLSRAAAPPPVQPSTQLQTLQTFLAPEIAQHLVVVLEDATTVRVRTTNGELFKSGSDQLNPGHEALFERIGLAVETQPGPVRIEGDADSDKVATLAFPDNLALSKARAETVATIVKSKLTDPSRVTTAGLGDTQPIAANDTPAGKSQNRRVEIVVQRRP